MSSASMRTRIASLRKDLVARLAKACPQRDFSFIERQRGMFSYLGVTTEQVRALRERHHVYMTDDSRMNVAGPARRKHRVLRGLRRASARREVAPAVAGPRKGVMARLGLFGSLYVQVLIAIAAGVAARLLPPCHRRRDGAARRSASSSSSRC